jgi:hypothetical protein
VTVASALAAAVAVDDRGETIHSFLDDLVARRGWDDLVAATELAAKAGRDEGHSHRRRMAFAAYLAQRRLVLAPPAIASRVMTHPFPDDEAEVNVVQHLAQQHSWGELSPHLDDPEHRRRFAYERVARGEDLSAEPGLDPAVVGLPFRLEPWEPRYVFTRYAPFPREAHPPAERVEDPVIDALERPIEPLPDDRVLAALLAFPGRWVTRSGSGGRATGAHVRGDVAGAFSEAGHDRGGLQQVAVQSALASLALASAAGASHRGCDGVVLARRKCWLLVAALADYDGPLPYPTGLFARSVRELRFYRLVPDWEPYSRWMAELHIGIERPVSREAWALTAGHTD